MIKERKGAFDMKVKKIYSKRIFEELMCLKKHKFLNTQDNLKYSWLKVFVFEETPELLNDLTILTHHSL